MQAPVMFLVSIQALAGLGTPDSERAPNVLMFLADDLGPEWLGCYGSEETDEKGGSLTPRLDRLAEESIRFRHCYATPLCSPSRIELLTGCYPFRTGWMEHHDAPRDGGVFFDWEQQYCLARAFRDEGYATALVGKWQVNNLLTQPEALREHGFERHCVWPGVEGETETPPRRYWDPVVVRDGERKVHEDEFGPDVFTGALIDFMAENRDEPFFALYSMILPHKPFTLPPPVKDRKLPREERFAFMVQYMDALVGRVLDAVDELGLRQHTLVVFTSDNGSPRTRARAWGRTVVGGKSSLEESGIAVPLMVRIPGSEAVSRVDPSLVDFTDLLPTCAEFAGVPLPRHPIDGRSFAGALRAEPIGERRQWILAQFEGESVLRGQRYKLRADRTFVDLETDPTEKSPFPASARAVEEECKILLAGLEELTTTMRRIERRRKAADRRDERPAAQVPAPPAK